MMTASKTVLIIEDDEAIRRIIRIELETHGVKVHEATNGAEALTAVASFHPNVLVLDVIMPRMHGMDFLRKLRENPAGKKIPVIILTNFADDPKVKDIVAEGGYTLLKKAESKLQDIVTAIRSKL